MRKIISFIFAIILTGPAFAQTGKAVDYLKVPGPLTFNQQSYKLNWSAHPSANYYKHEYIQKGDNTEHFTSMLMIEVMSGAANIKEIVGTKTAELDAMKKSNPIINYDIIENKKTGEYILDFVLSSGDIIEHNIYRYTTFTNNSGKKSLLLFAVSSRGYGKYFEPFLLKLKKDRPQLIQAVSAFSVPKVSVN